MDTGIKSTKIGKLRIYLKSGETIRDKRFFRRLFPKNKYSQLLDAAREAGIRNAHVYHTHAAYEQGGNIAYHHVEHGSSDLTICLELVDDREKLETFFLKHRTLLQNRTVIFKEVEMWSF